MASRRTTHTHSVKNVREQHGRACCWYNRKGEMLSYRKAKKASINNETLIIPTQHLAELITLARTLINAMSTSWQLDEFNSRLELVFLFSSQFVGATPREQVGFHDQATHHAKYINDFCGRVSMKSNKAVPNHLFLSHADANFPAKVIIPFLIYIYPLNLVSSSRRICTDNFTTASNKLLHTPLYRQVWARNSLPALLKSTTPVHIFTLGLRTLI